MALSIEDYKTIRPTPTPEPPQAFRELEKLERHLKSGKLSKAQVEMILASLRKAEPVLKAYEAERRRERLSYEALTSPWH